MSEPRFNSKQFPQEPQMNWALIEARLHTGPEAGSHISFETPRTLPESLLLPHVIYGDLISALIRQKNADPQVEESQFVGTQWKSPLFVDTITREGNPRRTDHRDEVLRLLKKNSAVITFWHTHTEFKSPYLTIDDISRSLNFSDRAVMTMLGTPKYIWCLVKTKQVPRNNKTINEVLIADTKLWQEIAAVYDSDQRPPDFAALSHYLDESGYALYVWFDTNGKSVKEAAENKMFDEGIPLRKMSSNSDAQIYQQLEHHAQVHLPHPDDVPKIPKETYMEFLGNATGVTKLAKKVRAMLKGRSSK